MTEPIHIVPVPLGERRYEIHIGSGNLDSLGTLLLGCLRPTSAIIITDQNVEEPYAARAVQSLTRALLPVDVLCVPPGEPSKSIDAARALWGELLALKADRKAVIVAVGGGVVGDLAGFVAATFARGIPLLQVPTTLLAQVDSSVGGKVGINLPGAKNIVGAFWQPKGVLIDTQVLGTLPLREYRAGLAEVVKYGIILDADLFAYLEAHVDELNHRDPAVLRHVIARCCELKADVVAQDEREETGLRAVLNYGHTFCHAFEAATGYAQLLHGEGVAIGMLCASRLAERLGRVDAELTRRQHALLAALGLPVAVPEVPPEKLLELMHHDKKTEGGRLRFVLPRALGHVELVGDVDPQDVLAALAAEKHAKT